MDTRPPIRSGNLIVQPGREMSFWHRFRQESKIHLDGQIRGVKVPNLYRRILPGLRRKPSTVTGFELSVVTCLRTKSRIRHLGTPSARAEPTRAGIKCEWIERRRLWSFLSAGHIFPVSVSVDIAVCRYPH